MRIILLVQFLCLIFRDFIRFAIIPKIHYSSTSTTTYLQRLNFPVFAIDSEDLILSVLTPSIFASSGTDPATATGSSYLSSVTFMYILFFIFHYFSCLTLPELPLSYP